LGNSGQWVEANKKERNKIKKNREIIGWYFHCE